MPTRIFIVSEKNEPTYRRLFARLGATPENFVMVGNSLKSNISASGQAGFPNRARPLPHQLDS